MTHLERGLADMAEIRTQVSYAVGTLGAFCMEAL